MSTKGAMPWFCGRSSQKHDESTVYHAATSAPAKEKESIHV